MTTAEQPNLTNEAEELIEDAMAAVKPSEEIETVLAGIAEDNKVMVAESQGSRIWQFEYGSATVFVQLTGETDEDTMTVWSPILQLPAKNEAQLMKKMLQMNWLSTFESHFAIAENQVVVVSSRILADISASEISRIITIVATIADDNDDNFKAEYGQ